MNTQLYLCTCEQKYLFISLEKFISMGNFMDVVFNFPGGSVFDSKSSQQICLVES